LEFYAKNGTPGATGKSPNDINICIMNSFDAFPEEKDKCHEEINRTQIWPTRRYGVSDPTILKKKKTREKKAFLL
jgi:hypothetical protein